MCFLIPPAMEKCQNTIWVRSNTGNPLFDQSRGIELTNLQESSSIRLSSQALPKQSRAGSSEMLALTARPLTAGAPRQRRQRRVECACQAPAESWRRAALCRHHCWAWRCRCGQAAERAGRLAVSSSRHWSSWSRYGRIACARSSIAPEVRRSPPIFTCTRSRRHIAPKVATLTADTKFSTRGRRVTDHTVACTSPLTHCPGYLQALEPSARPVQVFRAQLRCASCMLAQWQQHGAHLEPKLSLRLRCTSAWAVARATAQKCRCIVAVLAGTALAALAALV